jgi:hypothetical protein
LPPTDFRAVKYHETLSGDLLVLLQDFLDPVTENLGRIVGVHDHVLADHVPGPAPVALHLPDDVVIDRGERKANEQMLHPFRRRICHDTRPAWPLRCK